MASDEKIEQVLDMVRETQKVTRETREMVIEERALNNARFTQLASGLNDVRKELSGVKVEMTKMNINLNAKIDRVYDSLSQDIQVFAGDLDQVKRRLPRKKARLN